MYIYYKIINETNLRLTMFLSDLQLDTGSPLIVGGAIAGIISSHIHDSGNYFYFMPSTDIMEILRAANVENICNFFPVPGSEKNDDTQLRLSL